MHRHSQQVGQPRCRAMRAVKLSFAVMGVLLLSSCGFRGVSQLSLPIKTVHLRSDDINWKTAVAHQLALNHVTFSDQAPLKLVLKKPVISNSNTSIDESETTSSTRFTLSAEASLYRKDRLLSHRVLSASTTVYTQSQQLQSAKPTFMTQSELSQAVLNQIPFWLASQDVKTALRK